MYVKAINLLWASNKLFLKYQAQGGGFNPNTCLRPCSGLASPKFPFASILAGAIVALWRSLRSNEWEGLMITSPLLSNVRHRAMITPVSPLLTRLIYINPSYWTIHHSFESILEWQLPTGLEFQSNALCKSVASNKTFNLILQWAARALKDEPERTHTAKNALIYLWYDLAQ